MLVQANYLRGTRKRCDGGHRIARGASDVVTTRTRSTPALVPVDDGAESFEEAEALLNQLMRFIRLVKRASARYSSHAPDGIEQAAYILLAVLATEGPQRTTALAEAVHSDTSTVSRQVGALVRHGLVERQADPADGRACLLAATAKGQECFDKERRARTAQVAGTLAQWSREDLRAMVELFDRLNNDFENDEQPAGALGAPAAKGGNR
jgi:DNA-binding MarR family transcriptional regulator